MTSTVERPAGSVPAGETISVWRRAWDHMPSLLRRPILWTMRSERVRLRVLALLRIRDEAAFVAMSAGGAEAIEASLRQARDAGVSGDYYEFGVYRGHSFWSAQRAADALGLHTTRFFGFDSFEGLPEVVGNDRKAGVFVSGDYRATRSEVERNLVDHGFDMTRATLVEGYFDRSLTPELRERHQMRPAAVVMVDCDLYQSTVPVLAWVSELLQDGTIILFDDWYCFGDSEDHGERRAFTEFLADHPEWRSEPLMRFSRYGQGFVVRKSIDS